MPLKHSSSWHFNWPVPQLIIKTEAGGINNERAMGNTTSEMKLNRTLWSRANFSTSCERPTPYTTAWVQPLTQQKSHRAALHLNRNQKETEIVSQPSLELINLQQQRTGRLENSESSRMADTPTNSKNMTLSSCSLYLLTHSRPPAAEGHESGDFECGEEFKSR